MICAHWHYALIHNCRFIGRCDALKNQAELAKYKKALESLQPTVCPFTDCPCGEGCQCGATCGCGGQQRTIKQWVELIQARENSNLPPLKGSGSEATEMETTLIVRDQAAGACHESLYSSISVVGGGTMRMIHVSVGGMSCSSCVAHVEA